MLQACERLVIPTIALAGGIALGLLLARRRRQRQLPAPSACSSRGVVFQGKLANANPTDWVFLGNHFINLDFYNENVAGKENVSKFPKYDGVCYPVRIKKSAGFMRVWGIQHPRFVGDQTIACPVRTDQEHAHDFVGVLVPIQIGRTMAETAVVPIEHFEWLGWQEPPASLKHISVLHYGTGDSTDLDVPMATIAPPSAELPILQTFIDTALIGALHHGEEFAAEWLDTTRWWLTTDSVSYYLNDREQSRRPWAVQPKAPLVDRLLTSHPPLGVLKHRLHQGHYEHMLPATPLPPVRAGVDQPIPPPRAVRKVVSNFIVGFGSIIQTRSRVASDPNALDAAPCRINAAFGYVREWNFQASTAQICALGLRKCRPHELGATINGVIFPAPDDMAAFDTRENGYQRVEVPASMVELLAWQELPLEARVYVYVPYAPAVCAKYGVDEHTSLPRCMGPEPPAGLLQSEAAGLGLLPPSLEYPILQTYIDVCISGCLEHGEAFAEEFVRTTFKWSAYWLNERELARRPWVHQKAYVRIDALLRRCVPTYFAHRKLESEYAMLVLH